METKTAFIEGYDNYYSVSTDGTVKNKYGKDMGAIGLNNRVQVCLSNKGVKKYMYIHRLVALYFIPNPHNYKEIDHIDNNPCNNVVENLRWASGSLNNRNKFKNPNSKNKYKGVSWSSPMNKWRARVKINKKEINIGYANTEKEGAEMYNEYIKLNNLEGFWKLNIII